MQTPARPRVFPLIAITVVGVLLAAFLYLRFRKDGPAGVTDATPSSPASVPPEEAAPGRPDPAEEVRNRCIETAKSALEKGDSGAAAEAIARLRAAGGEKEAVPLEGELKRLEEKRKQEELRAAGEAFRLREAEIRKSLDDFRWDAARKACADLERDHPVLPTLAEYRHLRDKTEENAAEADRVFQLRTREAKEAMEGGRARDAIARVEEARSVYPERAEEADRLVRSAVEALQRAAMVFLPAPPEEQPWVVGDDAHADEAPRRRYRRGDFFIDRFEVTHEDYALFVRLTGHRAPRSKQWSRGRPVEAFARHPVTGVTLEDAAAYAKWAGKRLPEADEWEAAARWLDGRTYPWGPEYTRQENVFLCNSLEACQYRNQLLTQPVGSYPNGASPYGVFDLGGNVWEWTATRSTVEGDGGPRTLQVCKGGSYMTPAESIRSSNVYLEDPELAHHDLGFRCVRDP